MLRLQTRLVIAKNDVRDRLAELLQRGDKGATTLEYVVIAALIFAAAATLAGVIVNVIEREQSNIQNTNTGD